MRSICTDQHTACHERYRGNISHLPNSNRNNRGSRTVG
ncbi:hypothetical protein CES85_1863 [Ochrobactrum quorumnocens]|uniref:Uncharacterized protein n=1 Tax=Ochrobactrum quorumnocens TaxID=271865 RepID=A0A248UID3_9HYPH|nr:hypothetical protein CES85_1863 [[Ochrobactrum] quorumnocens]